MTPNNSAANPATGYDVRTALAMAPHAHHGSSALRVPVISGVLVGVLMAAAPLAFWWLPAATVYSLGLTLIAAIYVGFAIADGRRPAAWSSFTMPMVIWSTE
jgi:hypothetical protein